MGGWLRTRLLLRRNAKAASSKGNVAAFYGVRSATHPTHTADATWSIK
jgi:hypothetical protein